MGGIILCEEVPWPTDRSHIEMEIPTEPCVAFTGDRIGTRNIFSSAMRRMTFRQVQLTGDQLGKWAWERIA